MDEWAIVFRVAKHGGQRRAYHTTLRCRGLKGSNRVMESRLGSMQAGGIRLCKKCEEP